MKRLDLILAALLLTLAASPVAAQEKAPATIPDVVEGVALVLVRDGVMTEQVCEGSRDVALCRGFEKQLDELLAVEKASTSKLYDRPPFHLTRAARLEEIGVALEKLAPGVKDEKAAEALASWLKELKGLQ